MKAWIYSADWDNFKDGKVREINDPQSLIDLIDEYGCSLILSKIDGIAIEYRPYEKKAEEKLKKMGIELMIDIYYF